MQEKYFTVKNFPDDIYNAVGQIIKSAQEWEFHQILGDGHLRRIQVRSKKTGVLDLDKLYVRHEFVGYERVVLFPCDR